MLINSLINRNEIYTGTMSGNTIDVSSYYKNSCIILGCGSCTWNVTVGGWTGHYYGNMDFQIVHKDNALVLGTVSICYYCADSGDSGRFGWSSTPTYDTTTHIYTFPSVDSRAAINSTCGYSIIIL